MAAKLTTTQVTCPMHEGTCGETVAASGLTDFHATTVKVAACSTLVAQGWTGPQLVCTKTQAERLVPASTTTVVQHRAGLVWFAA